MFAVVVAAGTSSRMGDISQKQTKVFLPLYNNLTVLDCALKSLVDSGVVSGIVVVVREEDMESADNALEKYKSIIHTVVVIGGATRQQSVFNGLEAVKARLAARLEEVVLIHDGARPCVTPEKIKEVVCAARDHGAAILAVPVYGTLKKAEEDVRGDDIVIEQTINRQHLWMANTPQAFSFDLIYGAYKKAIEGGIVATDDSQLLEQTGSLKPNMGIKIIADYSTNIKITAQSDLELCAAILKSNHNNL